MRSLKTFSFRFKKYFCIQKMDNAFVSWLEEKFSTSRKAEISWKKCCFYFSLVVIETLKQKTPTL